MTRAIIHSWTSGSLTGDTHVRGITAALVGSHASSTIITIKDIGTRKSGAISSRPTQSTAASIVLDAFSMLAAIGHLRAGRVIGVERNVHQSAQGAGVISVKGSIGNHGWVDGAPVVVGIVRAGGTRSDTHFI
jgi:hypothetical protein